MSLRPFTLERYFARYEFSARYLLSSSDCDGLPLRDVLAMADDEARNLWENLTLGYTESTGHPLLRKEIARLYRAISPENCLVVVPEEGIYIALTGMLQSSDHVICSFPGYQSLYEVAESIGCTVTRWMPEEQDGWRFDPAFLERSIRPETKLLIINFPHNPTGYLPRQDDFQTIIDIARKHNLYVFSDEMYRFLEYDRKDRLPSVCEVYEKGISLFGMSKTFGLAGARIGWLVTKDSSLLSRIATIKDYTTICSSAPSEILSLIALRSGEAIIQKHLNRIRRNLNLLEEMFAEESDLLEWVKPGAGTVAFPRLKGPQSTSQLCEELVQKANIMLLPSSVYEFDDRHFRLGFGRENLPEVLEKFRDFLRSKKT
jgi:aspartate/methionine/tyrosine aminotransferase